jgi:hypothetical protein
MEMVKEDLIDSTKPAEKVKVEDNSSMMSAVNLDGDEPTDDEDSDEEELPKLDGAPVEEEATKLSMKTNYGKKSADSQSTFLSKLYK